jgi:hypothetical protein
MSKLRFPKASASLLLQLRTLGLLPDSAVETIDTYLQHFTVHVGRSVLSFLPNDVDYSNPWLLRQVTDSQAIEQVPLRGYGWGSGDELVNEPDMFATHLEPEYLVDEP